MLDRPLLDVKPALVSSASFTALSVLSAISPPSYPPQVLVYHGAKRVSNAAELTAADVVRHEGEKPGGASGLHLCRML